MTFSSFFPFFSSLVPRRQRIIQTWQHRWLSFSPDFLWGSMTCERISGLKRCGINRLSSVWEKLRRRLWKPSFRGRSTPTETVICFKIHCEHWTIEERSKHPSCWSESKDSDEIISGTPSNRVKRSLASQSSRSLVFGAPRRIGKSSAGEILQLQHLKKKHGTQKHISVSTSWLNLPPRKNQTYVLKKQKLHQEPPFRNPPKIRRLLPCHSPSCHLFPEPSVLRLARPSPSSGAPRELCWAWWTARRGASKWCSAAKKGRRIGFVFFFVTCVFGFGGFYSFWCWSLGFLIFGFCGMSISLVSPTSSKSKFRAFAKRSAMRLDAADGYKPLCQVPALVGGVRSFWSVRFMASFHDVSLFQNHYFDV